MTFPFKTTPFRHQLTEFDEHKAAKIRALFWEQGSGKSKPVIDTAAWGYMEGRHKGLCVIAPRNVHRNWITDELPAHLTDELAGQAMGHAYHTGKANTRKHKDAIRRCFENKGFSTIAFTYDSLKTEAGWHTFQYWMANRPSFLVADEARRMKTPGAKIGKRSIAVGRRAEYKRILDGTPVPNGPFDIHNPLKFLDEFFWKQYDMHAHSAFKTQFGVYREGRRYDPSTGRDREFREVVAYKDLDRLNAIIRTIGTRYLKDDVLDLPAKLYSKRYFDLTPAQTQIYLNIRDEFFHEWQDGKVTTAALAIVRLLRLHQITRGYIPIESGEPAVEIEGGNPCLELLKSVAADVPHQGIIWCRFNKDVDLVMEHLAGNAVQYDGRVSELQLDENKGRFKRGEVQWFVAKPQVGGSGLTLNNAKTVIYYSNDFDLDERQQSEDRCHRSGQTDHVHYIDLVGRLPEDRKTIDDYILNSLFEKNITAAQILGDKVKDWI